jgi:hypothetical protein
MKQKKKTSSNPKEPKEPKEPKAPKEPKEPKAPKVVSCLVLRFSLCLSLSLSLSVSVSLCLCLSLIHSFIHKLLLLTRPRPSHQSRQLPSRSRPAGTRFFFLVFFLRSLVLFFFFLPLFTSISLLRLSPLSSEIPYCDYLADSLEETSSLNNHFRIRQVSAHPQRKLPNSIIILDPATTHPRSPTHTPQEREPPGQAGHRLASRVRRVW